METLSEDNSRAETSGSDEKNIKYEIEQEVPIDQKKSLYAQSNLFQKIFFGWSFPITKIAN